MAKGTGLGQKMFLGGYSSQFAVDLSGDIGSVENCHGGPELITVTGIDKSAIERIGGRRDGGLDWTAYFNPSSGQAHAYFSTLPTGDILALYCSSATVGDPVAAIYGRTPTYDGKRAANGALTFNVSLQGDGYGLEWCKLYKAKGTDASAANGTTIDGGTQGTAVSYTSTSAANPTVVTYNGHGLVTGDSVVFAGTNKAALNGEWTVTVTGANTFTVPVDLSGGAATGGTYTKTSTNYGASAYMLAFALASGTVVPEFQDSADNTTFTAVTGMTLSGVTTGPANVAQRVQSSSTQPIRRYTRFASTGTFSNAQWAAAAIRHLTATL